MNKYTLYIIIAVSLLASACAGNEEKNTVKKEQTGVGIGVTRTMDCLPMAIAVNRGMIDSTMVIANLRYFNAHMDADTAILGGSCAAVFSESIRARRLTAKNSKIDTYEHDNLNWQLIACLKQRIVRIDQLKDHMIAMTRLSATAKLSEALLDSAKLNDQKAFMVPINNISLRLKMLSNGEMDAAWLPQPQADIATANGHKRLTSSIGSKVEVKGVLAVNEKLLPGKRFTAIRKAYNAACDSINKYGMDHYADIARKHFGIYDNDYKKIKKPHFTHL